MGNWTGRWKLGFQEYKPCPCGNPKGVMIQHEYFDAECPGSMKHDGEDRIASKSIICENCNKPK